MVWLGKKLHKKWEKPSVFWLTLIKSVKQEVFQVNYISLVFGWRKRTRKKATHLYRMFFLPAGEHFVSGRDWHGSHPTERWGWLHVRWRWASAGAQMIFWESKGPKTRGFSPVFSRKWPAFLRVAGGKRGIVAVPCCDECELKYWLWDGVKRLVFSGKCTSCTSNTNHICTPLEEMAQWRIFFKWVGSNTN